MNSHQSDNIRLWKFPGHRCDCGQDILENHWARQTSQFSLALAVNHFTLVGVLTQVSELSGTTTLQTRIATFWQNTIL